MTAQFVTSPSLAVLPGVHHAFFTREGGVSQGIYATLNGGRGSADSDAHVIENRLRMTAALGVTDGRLATPHQIHSAITVIADEPWSKGEAPQADAVVTSIPGLAIGIGTADCGPVLFADPDARIIGAAHAGWKGALGGILGSTVHAMEKLGARRGSITAALGPCLRKQSYEVGEEFVAAFESADPGNVRFFVPGASEGKSMFDLGGYIVSRLLELDLARVEDLGLDTYADETRFFSYRRATHRKEPDYGRLIAAIALA